VNNVSTMEHQQVRTTAIPAVETGIGVALLAATGLIHLLEAPEYWGEVRYIGGLFVVGAVVAIAAAFGVLLGHWWGWQLGLAVAGGMGVAYVLSRTVGIPQFREASLDKFLEPFGLGSLIVEALFVVLALRVLGRHTTA
jgi:hypothetical protein